MKKKKTYISPIIELVNLDRELVLLNTSENTGPGHPGPDTKSPKNQTYPSDINKFNDNPFEK